MTVHKIHSIQLSHDGLRLEYDATNLTLKSGDLFTIRYPNFDYDLQVHLRPKTGQAEGEWISDIPTEDKTVKNKWISVKEKMPPDDSPVLGWSLTTDEAIIVFAPNEDSEEWTATDIYGTSHEIEHWQPLPDRPEQI